MRQLAALAFVFTSLASGLDVSKLEARGYLNDFAGVVDARSASAIETSCANVERATGAQFAIAVVESHDADTVE